MLVANAPRQAALELFVPPVTVRGRGLCVTSVGGEARNPGFRRGGFSTDLAFARVASAGFCMRAARRTSTRDRIILYLR